MGGFDPSFIESVHLKTVATMSAMNLNSHAVYHWQLPGYMYVDSPGCAGHEGYHWQLHVLPHSLMLRRHTFTAVCVCPPCSRSSAPKYLVLSRDIADSRSNDFAVLRVPIDHAVRELRCQLRTGKPFNHSRTLAGGQAVRTELTVQSGARAMTAETLIGQ